MKLIPVDDDHFTVKVEVAVSNQFFGWLIGLGKDVQLLEPQSAREKMAELVKDIIS